jgi:hypothetical protein
VKTHGKNRKKITTLKGLNPCRVLEFRELHSTGLNRWLFKFKPFGLNFKIVRQRDDLVEIKY